MALDRMVAGDLQLPHTATLVSRYQLLLQALGHSAALEPQALVDRLFPADEVGCEEIRALACGLVEDQMASADLLEGLMTALTQPELPGSQDGVIRIMSLHKSKGLTARLVIVAGCLEGVMPMIDQDLPLTGQRAMCEEQRRLFYVALTRTTECLVLSSPAEMTFADAKRMGVTVQRRRGDRVIVRPTRFIAELGPARPSTQAADQWRLSLGF